MQANIESWIGSENSIVAIPLNHFYGRDYPNLQCGSSIRELPVLDIVFGGDLSGGMWDCCDSIVDIAFCRDRRGIGVCDCCGCAATGYALEARVIRTHLLPTTSIH